MDDLQSAILLCTMFATIAAHVVLVAILKPSVPAAFQSVLFAWGHVRGGKVMSLRIRYIVPWASVPALPQHALLLLRAAQVSAVLAVGAFVAFVAVALKST